MKKLSLFCVLALSIGVVPNVSFGQEEPTKEEPKVKIEIVNQDGENVKPGLVSRPNNSNQAGSTFRVESKDGKVTIVDEDGNARELNADSARSIIFQQSVQSTDSNGKKETKRAGKAIIVGPDGTRKEIDLGDGSNLPFVVGNWQDMAPLQGVFRFDRNDNQFMIGVSCEPTSPALASQLRLATGTGVVVVDLDSESPAAKAGVELHDILMFADQTELTSLEQLVESVQTAGKEDRALSLTLIRGGKEQSVEVKPMKRPANVIGATNSPWGPMNEQFEMQFRGFGPGMVVGNEDFSLIRDRMKKQMEQVKAQMEALEKQMQDQFGDDQDR